MKFVKTWVSGLPVVCKPGFYQCFRLFIIFIILLLLLIGIVENSYKDLEKIQHRVKLHSQIHRSKKMSPYIVCFVNSNVMLVTKPNSL